MNNKGQNGFDLINNKGQTLYYFLILMMLVFISWAMMLNIAKVIIERMKLQNEVDNIALSIAVDKARVMNFVGGCNYLIGSILASGTKPEFIQIPAYNTDAVAAYHNGDYKKNGGTRDGDVKKIKLAVEALQNAQDAALISHLAYQDYLIAKSVSKESALLIMPFAGLPSKTNAQKYFGLKRNSKGIRYLKTINGEMMSQHIVYNPFPGGDIIKPILKLLNTSGKNVSREDIYAESDYSWYVTDENFHKQKIKVMLTKLQHNKNKPIFAKLFGGLLHLPAISAFSAASIYNTKGTMFPTKENNLIGSSYFQDTAKIRSAAQGAQLYAGLFSKDSTPYKIVANAVLAYMTAELLLSWGMSLKGDKKGESPISEYNKAKSGGWNAHLVPYKREQRDKNG